MNTAKPRKMTLSASERVNLAWIKARSSTANGACVEVAVASAVGNIAIRDSKDPNGPILVYTPSEFRAFLEGARNGEFDNLVGLPTAPSRARTSSSIGRQEALRVARKVSRPEWAGPP